MTDISQNAILQIIKGVAKIPQSSTSAEQGLDSINLLDPLGFACDTYEMQIPNLKGNAVWADSPLTDGRQPTSGALGNVTETIRLNLTAGTLVQMAAMLSKLVQFRRDCNDFWSTFYQIEPVYLKHQVIGEPGPRYALLYNIEINIEQPLNSNDSNRIITLSIEREPYWRALAPGDNPKRWTIENFFTGQTWSPATSVLTSGSNHLFNGTVNNRTEWNTTQTALLSQSYVDIPASSIPGDAPALVENCILLSSGSGTVSDIVVGLTTKPDLVIDAAGSVRIPNYNLNGADGTVGTDTTAAADTGAPVRSSSGVASRLNCTFATVATSAERVRWDPARVGTYFDFSTLRGRYMVFLRARLSAAGTVTLQLNTQGSIGEYTSPLFTLTDNGSGGTGNTTYWKAAYMGVISFPISNQPIPINDSGIGIEVPTSGATPILRVYAARTSGTPVLYISDLVFIPIDEGSWLMNSNAYLGVGNGFILDDTGYYMHGKTDVFFDAQGVVSSEGRFSNFYLAPKKRNRLVFLFSFDAFNGTPFHSDIRNVYSITLNIVPRWQGLRTE